MNNIKKMQYKNVDGQKITLEKCRQENQRNLVLFLIKTITVLFYKD